MNKLVEELSAQALAAWDTENHFRALAATGDTIQALAILNRLDDEDRSPSGNEFRDKNAPPKRGKDTTGAPPSKRGR
jgi:hypothetical protein